MTAEDAATTNIIVVDVGNQITRLGLFFDDTLTASWSVVTRPRITATEAQLSLESFFTAHEVCDASSYDSVLSSVVPSLSGAWTEALTSVCSRRPLLVGPGLKTGIKMKYNDPSELGSDRIATMIAAKERYGYPLVIIDCSAVINYQVLDAEGAFVGGIITPGLELSAETLSHAAARLPEIDLGGSTPILGKNTRESMRSGIIRGEAARIEGLVNMIWQELGYETDIVLTGEDARRIAGLLNLDKITVHGELTLLGLHMLSTINRKKKGL